MSKIFDLYTAVSHDIMVQVRASKRRKYSIRLYRNQSKIKKSYFEASNCIIERVKKLYQ